MAEQLPEFLYIIEITFVTCKIKHSFVLDENLAIRSVDTNMSLLFYFFRNYTGCEFQS